MADPIYNIVDIWLDLFRKQARPGRRHFAALCIANSLNRERPIYIAVFPVALELSFVERHRRKNRSAMELIVSDLPKSINSSATPRLRCLVTRVRLSLHAFQDSPRRRKILAPLCLLVHGRFNLKLAVEIVLGGVDGDAPADFAVEV